jgi:hypothetical protein
MAADSHFYEIWTSAAVLIGFQLTAFTWRLSRELTLVDAHPYQKNWLPPADYLNLLSLLVLITTVFVIPSRCHYDIAPKGVGLSLILLLGYPIAIAGHYRLFRVAPPRPRPYCTLQESWAVTLTLLGATCFMVVKQFFAGRFGRLLDWAVPLGVLWFILGISVYRFAVDECPVIEERGCTWLIWIAHPIAAARLTHSRASECP